MTGTRRRVMVVEDDPSIAEILEKTLSRFYEVRIVRDGGKAQHEISGYKPDIILLDVNLPNLDGFSIAQALKGTPALSRIPIVFLTAQDRSLDVVKGIQVGAKHYITKPFKLDDVLAKVKKLVPA
ncbi:MAG TPA: response regulator [Polyangiaceae bacterium]|nr:response regulator [Polyangiaceae bacterium]